MPEKDYALMPTTGELIALVDSLASGTLKKPIVWSCELCVIISLHCLGDDSPSKY